MNEAAKKLLVSQASLSAAVRELEDEFSIRIFDRSNKGVRVTKDGAEFIRYARQLIAQYEVINDRYRSENRTGIRNFAVTAQHYDFVAEAFVSYLKGLSSDYSVSLKEARTAQVIEDVTNLSADVGILAYLKEQGESYMERYLRRNGLEYREFLETKPHVFLGRQHPLSSSAVLRPDQLGDYPYVTYDQGESGPMEFSEELTENHMSRKQVRISDRATLMNLLLSTDCYTIGTGIMTSELNQGSVVAVPLDSPDVYAVALIYRADTGLSDDAERFIRALKSIAAGTRIGE
jgi:DNA-binding transcriptional LysR family regulator